MTRLSQPWLVFAVSAAAAIAAAGCGPQHGLTSSVGALSTPHRVRLSAQGQSPTSVPFTVPPRRPSPKAGASQTSSSSSSPGTSQPPGTSPGTKPSSTSRGTSQPSGTSPGTKPSSTSRGTSQPSSTSPGTSGTACVTSAQMGHCPFGPYQEITGASTDPYVDQNVWNPISGWHQTLHATDPGHWYVTANMPSGNTAVVSFPNTGFSFNKPLSGFSSIVSSFTDSIPSTNGTNAEASYDIWFSNTSKVNEVMIQNDYSPGRSPSCGTWTATNVQFGGSNGVPTHPWDLCVSGSTAFWETADGNTPSGTIDALAMLKWLVSHGQLPTGVELTGFSYGFEISSTGGANENFQVSSFSLTAS